MRLTEQLRDELAEFDGKAVSILSELQAQHRKEAGFLDCLLTLCSDKNAAVSDGASWIIKAHIDEGGGLSPKQVDALTAAAPKTHSWAAQLHLCQVIGRLALSKKNAERLAPWLADLLDHERPFLRAWSVDALWAAAKADARLRPKADEALKAALADKAASVRARAKKIK